MRPLVLLPLALLGALAFVGCDPAEPEMDGGTDAGPPAVDAGPACPTHLRFENIPEGSRLQLGYTGFGGSQLPDLIAFTAEIESCDPSCTRCNFVGPARNSDVNNQRCLGNTAIECETDAECEAMDAGTCRFLWGSPQSLVARPGVPPSLCYSEVFPTPEEHRMFAPNKPMGPSVAGTMDLRSGQVIFERLAYRPLGNFNGMGGEGSCPQCLGDATPNDGIRDGVCTADGMSDPNSPTLNQACDVNGAGRSVEGSFSNDCGPRVNVPSGFLISLAPSSLGFRVPVDQESPMAVAEPGTRVLCGECLGTDLPIPCLRDSDCGADGPCGSAATTCGDLNPPALMSDGTPNPMHNDMLPVGACLDGQPFVANRSNACLPGEECVVEEGAVTGTCNGFLGPQTECFRGGEGQVYEYTPPPPEVRDGFYIVRVGGLECLPSFGTAAANSNWGFPGPVGMQYGFRVIPEFRGEDPS